MEARKLLLVASLLSGTTVSVCAQVPVRTDTLLLKGGMVDAPDLPLNEEAVRSIRFDSSRLAPVRSEEKSWLEPDRTLPVARLLSPKPILTLRPYQSNTPYNWDPVYQKKITVGKNTWRNDPLYELSYWRQSFNGNASVHPASEYRPPVVAGMRGGGGSAGGSIGGLNLMLPFTKEFWDFRGKRNRNRTREVLQTYGDSTTVLINHPIMER